ncbi:TPA: 50S ribosomal protein L4 [Candidatus Micrarchaeota archaeon]|nr:50S ribosomal protein L4 [Candidatus Micrarchaeota archaeon]HIH29837.1 50S ribosomal protein L4 [Candidatus Micrarchaeota archaeon]
MKANIYSIEGKALRQVELPLQFSAEVRLDLISRASISDQTRHYQPKGNDPRAGMETSARYRGRKEDFGSGKNKGTAIRPREVLPKGRLGKVKRIPSAVKGRRAHPPHVNKIIFEKLNRKEYHVALISAIAATGHKEVVAARGHKVEIALPIVVDNSFESVAKTKDVYKALSLLIRKDLQRAENGKKRSGVGSRKGGKVYPKSAIIAVSKDAPLLRSARNIPGVDAVRVSDLSAELLAPGAKAGRLAIYTEAALAEIAKL